MCELTLDAAGLKAFEVKMRGTDNKGNTYKAQSVIAARSSTQAFGLASQRMKICGIVPGSIVVRPVRG